MNKHLKSDPLRLKKALPILFVYLVMVFLAVAINFVSPGFLTLNHICSILKQASFLGLVCIGQTLIILSGGIDLSAEYTLLLANVVSAAIISGKSENTLLAFLTVLGIGIAAGLINGAGVYFLKIPAMIITLATGMVLYGLSYIYCNGAPGGYASDILSSLVNSRFLSIFSGASVIWIVLSALCIVLLSRTTVGRSIHAIGTNRTASVYSGINVCLTTLGIYVIASVMAALSGFLLLGYTGTSYMSTGSGYNMDSIAAVVIGGTSIVGGPGGYIGTIAGVGIMILINSLLTVLNVPEAVKQIVQGSLIIVLLLAVYKRKKMR